MDFRPGGGPHGEAFVQRNPEISVIAGAIRSEYCKLKAAKIGHAFKLSTKDNHISVWEKAAVTCIQLKASPIDYVQAVFKFCRQKTGPYPNQMHGAAPMAWWNQYAGAAPQATDDKAADAPVTNGPAKAELISQMGYIAEMLQQKFGTYSPLDNRVKECLRNHVMLWPAHLRCLLMPGDPETLEAFGIEARDFLFQNPTVVCAAQELGLPVNEILQWQR